MPLRYLGEYITQVRRDATIRDSSFSNGISDDQLVEYLRDAQDRLQSKLFSRYPSIFEVETTFVPVANQEAYIAPSDDYAVNSVVSLEYTPTGVDRDYYFLTKNILTVRTNIPVNYPTQYILSGNRILIQPKITNAAGNFRLVYTKQLPSVDVRRAKIASTTNDGTYYTTLTLDSTYFHDDTNLASAEYLSICDKHGTLIYSGISVTSYNATSLVIVPDPGTCPISLGAIVTGNYVTIGAVCTTHSILPGPMGGRYLMAFATWRMLQADNAVSAGAKEKEVEAYENDILETFGNSDRDVPEIPYTEDFI